MELQFLKVDQKESGKWADRFRRLLEPKACYDNVANIILAHPDIRDDYPGLEVAYGGVQVFPNDPLYARHILFLYEGRAIDPTLALAEGGVREGIQFFPIQQMGVDAYLDYLETHGHTSPADIFQKMETVSHALLAENIYLIG